MVIYSASRIKLASSCMARYAYRYWSKAKEEFANPHFIKGRVVHRAADCVKIRKNSTFFKYDKNGEIVPRFQNEEKFGNTLRVRWLNATRENKETGYHENNKLRIKWIHGNPDQRYWIAADVKNSGINLYRYLIREGIPLDTEFKFTLKVGDIWLRGAIDEIREGNLVVDHKVSKNMEGMVLDHDHQLTIYSLVYISFAIYDKNFRNKFGITDNQVKLWRKDPLNSIEDVKLRYHLTISGDIVEVKRGIRDIKNLVDKVNDLRHAETYKRFTPNEGFHCNLCEYQRRCEMDRASKSPLDIDQLPLLIQPSPLEINVENLVLNL